MHMSCLSTCRSLEAYSLAAGEPWVPYFAELRADMRAETRAELFVSLLVLFAQHLHSGICHGSGLASRHTPMPSPHKSHNNNSDKNVYHHQSVQNCDKPHSLVAYELVECGRGGVCSPHKQYRRRSMCHHGRGPSASVFATPPHPAPQRRRHHQLPHHKTTFPLSP